MATNTEEYYPAEIADIDEKIRLAAEQAERAINRLQELIEKRKEYQEILKSLAGQK